MPVAVGENKSPVVHAEHTLGLQEWCVRHLYLHVYHKLISLKRQQRLRREGKIMMFPLHLARQVLHFYQISNYRSKIIGTFTTWRGLVKPRLLFAMEHQT